MAWPPFSNEAISEYTSEIDTGEQMDFICEYIQGHIDAVPALYQGGHDA